LTEFIKAADLKKKYKVKGRFYVLTSSNSTTKCRSLLTITDTTATNKKKLLVIMLNPGSSRPLDDKYLETEILVTQMDQLNNVSLIDAKPDTTQYQIMRVMNELQFSYADIINLYDIREPKSGLLFDKAKKGELQSEASIFSDPRQSELANYFTPDTSVILGWGNAKPIKEIEKTAINKVSKLTNKIFTVRGNDNIIYHPSPQNHNFKLMWLDNIYGQLRALDK
jgi:hypothetical protein